MADDENIVYAKGVSNASFTNGPETENDEVANCEDQKSEQVNECADGDIASRDNYAKGFFIESTSKAEVDCINSNFVDESEFLDDADNIEEKEHGNVDEIEMRDKSEVFSVPSLWTLCSEHLKVVYDGDIEKVRCVFEYVKNLYKHSAMKDTEIVQSEIFDILVCNKDTKEEGKVPPCTLKTNDSFADEGDSELTKVLDNTPEHEDENPVDMDKVIGTVCEVSTTKAGSPLDENETCSKISEAEKLNTSARSSTSFDNDEESTESDDDSDTVGENGLNSPVISLGSRNKGEQNDGNVCIVQSRKALRDIEKKTSESSANENDTTVVIKVEDTSEGDQLNGKGDESKSKKMKSPELIDITKKDTNEEYSYNESSMEEATGSQIHGDSGEFVIYIQRVNLICKMILTATYLLSSTRFLSEISDYLK